MYVKPPIPTDPEELLAGVFAYLQSVIPGWEPADGNLDVWLAEAFAQIGAEVGEVASDVPEAIFRHFGASLLGLPPREAVQASGFTEWTLIDTAGYLIPAGTTIGGTASDGSLVAFQTTVDVEVLAGDSVAASVPVVALEQGLTGTGIVGAAEVIDPLDFVASVTFTAATTGGQDAESDEEYLDRLVAELRLLTPRPILPADFATLALRVDGVGRALALDGYDPGDDSTGNERMVTVAVAEEDGTACSSGVRSAVDALLQAEREVSFQVHVIDPTYTAVDVNFEATVWPAFNAADVIDAAEAAVTSYLSPATWGTPDYGDQAAWELEEKVLLGELYAVLNGVEGIRHVTLLEFAKSGDPLATTDVTLDGPAPLPTPGTITGLEA